MFALKQTKMVNEQVLKIITSIFTITIVNWNQLSPNTLHFWPCARLAKAYNHEINVKLFGLILAILFSVSTMELCHSISNMEFSNTLYYRYII